MKRRDFLVTSSILSAGIGSGLTGCRKKTQVLAFIPDKDRIKTGIIGVGERGNTILQVLKQVPEIKIIACCDILDFRIEEALKNISEKIEVYKDYRKLIENKELDAVIISTPLHEHHQMVMDAIDAGLHIMCEKTLAYNISQAMAIRDKAKSYDRIFQVSYQYQMNPVLKALKR